MVDCHGLIQGTYPHGLTAMGVHGLLGALGLVGLDRQAILPCHGALYRLRAVSHGNSETRQAKAREKHRMDAYSLAQAPTDMSVLGREGVTHTITHRQFGLLDLVHWPCCIKVGLRCFVG